MKSDEFNVFYYAYKNVTDILKNYELYTFEKSALLAASDIRIDKPQGLEQISELVFEQPRKIFIEAAYQERKNLFKKLNIYERESDLIDIGDPTRVGIIIDAQGSGIANIRVCWITPKKIVKQHIDKDAMRDIGLHKSDVKLFQNLTALNFSVFEIRINTNDIQNTTIEDFKDLLDRNDENAVEIYNFVERRNLLFGQTTLDRSWQLYRLNQFSSLHLNKDGIKHVMRMTKGLSVEQTDTLLDTLKDDLSGEMLFAIAMLGVLEIENLDVRKVNAKSMNVLHSKKHYNKANNKTQEDSPIRLGIVSIDIDKGIEAELYKGVTHHSSATSVKQDSSFRKSPVIHAVRGHLFKARNGKIIYRKPHWRGKARDVNFIKRVH